MNPTAVVTIVSNNYLHFARTLLQSVARHHPQAARYCVIVDRDLSHAQALSHEFQTLSLDQLQLPDGDDFLFQYTVLELNTAVKPWALAHLVRMGHQQVLYIDPDIALYRPLDEVFSPLGSGADIVLTPHLLAPVTDQLSPGELDIRRTGTYNLGFCAVRASANTQAMLLWWQGKLQHQCVVALEQGIFVDQSWMDLVPGLFDHVVVLRHPGYNVAYWNLAQRPITESSAGFLAAGEPLAFFHYSGLNPFAPHAISRHQNRVTLDDASPALTRIITDYSQSVVANGIEHYRAMAYGFACFDDGTPITDTQRAYYRALPDLRRAAQGQPFANPALVNPDQLQARHPEYILRRMYVHFLGRLPDETARANNQDRPFRGPHQWRHVFALALSSEARAKPGWLLRLLCWPMQAALLPPPDGIALTALAPPGPARRPYPAPYIGLHGVERDSAQAGIWVGPTLSLPLCAFSTGRVCITGTLDLALLSRGLNLSAFRLEVHAAGQLLHSAVLTHSGHFSIDFVLPRNAFANCSQWELRASKHVIPGAVGLGQDSRPLAWRVIQIRVDDHTLVDSTQSPCTAAIESLVPARGVNLIGYLTAELGFGEGTRALARSLQAADVPYSAIDVGFQTQHPRRDASMLARAVKTRFAIDLLYVNADQTVATADYLKRKKLSAHYRIGYWVWEQPQLPSSVFGAFAHVDEIWVPSSFAYQAIAPYAPVPVNIIPHAIEFAPSPQPSRSEFGLPQHQILVLVMYDFHSYQYRKNPQAAVAAFRQAAADRRDATLVIKTINSQHHTAARQALKDELSDLPNVILIDQFLTRQQTWDLQACCDILLSLHRAEGFGLALAEMMYLGKPVVATGWSANLDFMTPDNSMPVQYQLQPLQNAVGVYPAGQLWAEADTSHAAHCLSQLFDQPALRQRLGTQAAADIRRQLSPQAVGAQVARRLAMLCTWQPLLNAVI
ncbi:MAG: glycosyltransferase [Rhodoferax sp.]|nr:glycosyltransferase [Rhodoferax sp.]